MSTDCKPIASGPADRKLPTEEEFIAHAKRFFTKVGVNVSDIDPDFDLLDGGVLDSLLLLAFLAFIDEQRGPEAELLQPEDIIQIRTLRTAYALVSSKGPRS